MRHFDFLTDAQRGQLFFREPSRFSADDDPRLIAVGLGATLYSPATRLDLVTDLGRCAARGVVSTVLCLEDSVADVDVADAEINLIAQLRAYAAGRADGPLIFVRVRTPEQIDAIVAGLGEHIGVLTGFVLPKFTARCGARFLDRILAATAGTGHRLLAMPVLESREVSYVETRTHELLGIAELLGKYRQIVAAVRIGATDLCAGYGLRRARDLSVYDLHAVAAVIADVVNILGRADSSGFVVTGPVWEYFPRTERMFKPQLRVSPFVEHAGGALRAELIAGDLDGLIREIALDKANGLTGKTVIHPSHVPAVHALSVVTHEEYSDAADVLGSGLCGGALASSYRNKMNESKPHAAWAERIVMRARVFGVAHSDVSFVDLLGAGLPQ